MELVIDTFISVALMIGISIYFRVLLQLAGQAWIKTMAHTATLTLLPILTFVITKVISGNIALSLGLVGALSIVRFRNPVRSPLELSVYFGAITMGIAAAVSDQWLLLFLASTTLVLIILFVIHGFSRAVLKKPFFISSFSEGNNLATLNVVAEQEISILDEHENLMSKSLMGGEVSYTLANSSFAMLKNIEETLQSNSDIKSLQLNR